MASLTVRQIDEALKKQLRLRAARNGRSVEDEVRTILREAASDTETPAAPAYVKTAPANARTKRVLLIVGGGIAAYKSLDLIRRMKERGLAVRCILTQAATEFITPLAAGAIIGGRGFTDLFDPHHEFDVGHIRLAREADVIVVAPATADLMAKMANGLANDLATAVLLAAKAKILLAPAMNPAMWSHKATQRNLAQLIDDGVSTIGPHSGEMAESGERGWGRMAEPLEIAAAAEKLLGAHEARPLKGKRVLITAGPTHEPIDPVRYIANRSSGKQGYAIAIAAAQAGADVTLISGPVNLPRPAGVDVVDVENAREMLAAVERALPADVAIFAAAVADWRVANAGEQKIKKRPGRATPELALTENPDILSTVAHRKTQRPQLVVGFAAETENVAANAKAKLDKKGCDWILANDVSPSTGIMGGDRNTIQLITAQGIEPWPPQSKEEVATMLMARIGDALGKKQMIETDVRITRLAHGQDLPLPSYQSTLAAGLDLIAAVAADKPLTLAAGARALVPTGIAIALPEGFEAQVRPRSGLAVRHGLTVLNSPGTIDADYRGEIQVLLVNLGNESVEIVRGMRIAQLVLATVARARLTETSSLDQTTRGGGGFGSTGS